MNVFVDLAFCFLVLSLCGGAQSVDVALMAAPTAAHNWSSGAANHAGNSNAKPASSSFWGRKARARVKT